MKNLIYAMVVFAVGCGTKIESPEKVDYTTDFSREMSSEVDLNKNGCAFKQNSRGSQDLSCKEQDKALSVYRQRISLYRYERNTSDMISSGTIRTPKGKLVNSITLYTLRDKWQTTYSEIYLPLTAHRDPKRFLQFSKVSPQDETESADTFFTKTLEILLEGLLQSNIIVEVHDDLSIEFDFKYANNGSLENLKSIIEKYALWLQTQTSWKNANSRRAHELLMALNEKLGEK